MAYGINQSCESNYNAMLYSKTNIDGYFFDAVTKVDYEHTLSVTSHPVQTGANITDHSYMEPKKISMTVCMSDVMVSRYGSQFSGSWSRSRKGWDILVKLQENRVPVSVLTRLGRYDNMVIISLKQSDENSKDNTALHADVILQEVIMARLGYAKVSSMPAKSYYSMNGVVSSDEFDFDSYNATALATLTNTYRTSDKQKYELNS